MRLHCTVQIYLLHLFPSLTILSMYLKWNRIDDVIISLIAWSVNPPVTSHWQAYHILLYRDHLAWVGFKLTTSVVIATDCTGSCKSNYHTITTVMDPIEKNFTCVIINMHKVWLTFRAGLSYRLQAWTLTFVRLSGTSENWRRTSRSCITVVRRDKWKNQIPKRAGAISTGIKYWVCCIKEPCLISNLSIIYFY